MPHEAPHELVKGSLDKRLSRLVMDCHWVKSLQKELRCTVHKCYSFWTELGRRRENNRIKSPVDPKEIELVKKNLFKTKLILADTTKETTSYLEETRENDTLLYAREQLRLAEEWIADTNGHDVTHVSERIDTGELHTFHRHHEKEERDEANTPNQAAKDLDSWELKRKILLQQRKMVALTRLLTLQTKVDPILSTRGSGQYVSIA